MAQKWICLKFKEIKLNQARGLPGPNCEQLMDRSSPWTLEIDWTGRFSNNDIESWSFIQDPDVRSLRLSPEDAMNAKDFDSFFMTFEDWQQSFDIFV